MKTGTIKHIDINGQWNGMNKHLVTFADGQQFTFFSKGDFKASIGETIKYTISNAEMRNAKLVRDNNFSNKSFTPSNKKDDVQTSIIRQTCLKASAELHSQRGESDVQSVLEDAEIMYNWVIK